MCFTDASTANIIDAMPDPPRNQCLMAALRMGDEGAADGGAQAAATVSEPS